MSSTELAAWCEGHPHRAIALAGLLLLLFGALMQSGTSERRGGPRRTAAFTLQILGWLVLSAIISIGMVNHGRWGYLFALIPGVLVARHASYLRLVRRRGMMPDFDTEAAELETAGFEKKKFVGIFSRARAAHDREFRVDVLALRYGVPALLVSLVGIADFEVLVHHPPANITREVCLGAEFALAGAYTYVLLYLGQRSLRRDLTSGAAVWAAVTMTIGPILGGVLALLWRPTTDSTVSWSFNAIFFVTGLAPRYAASAVEEVVKRLWLTRSAAAPVTVAAVPLTQIRGITPEIEDRLSEEGITDACALAMAEPMKLYRNTAFDQRQILSWIDEALLVVFFPEDWQDVRKADVTGAIDLATRYSRVRHSAPQVGDEFDTLAQRIAEPSLPAPLLRDIASLVYEDAQVELVWALYQVNDVSGADDSADGPDGAPGESISHTPASGTAPAQASTGAALWFALAVAGALLAALSWNTDWPLSSAHMQLVGAFGLLGASALVAAVATPFVEPHATSRWRLVVVAIALVLLAAGVLWASPTRPFTAVEWRLGPVFLVMAAATFGASVAWAIVAAVTNTAIVVDLVPLPKDKKPLVQIDGAVREETAGRGTALTRGVHEVFVQCEGYRDIALRFDTRLLRWRRLQLRLLAAVPCGIVVTVRPESTEGLTITLVPLGLGEKKSCPADEFVPLPLGPWMVAVQADGFKRRTHTVDIRSGERLQLKVKLKRERVSVKVRVPKGASIVALFADGVRQPIGHGSDEATMTLKTGEREIALRWTDAPPAAGVAGGVAQPPQTQEETRRVLVPKGGTTVGFPS